MNILSPMKGPQKSGAEGFSRCNWRGGDRDLVFGTITQD